MIGPAPVPSRFPLPPRPPRALYVHVPFCTHRCHYCDFAVTRSADPPIDRFLAAIEGELAWWFETGHWIDRPPLDSVFVGGGTPSLLGARGMERLGACLERRFRFTDDLEWTAEANPASFDRPLAVAWKGAGVNRVSLGVQALDDDALAWLGRLHDRKGAIAAVEAALEGGVENVSLDLLFGLPETVERNLPAEIDTALGLGPTHLSVYGLTIEPGTPLARRVELGRVLPVSEARYAIEYRAVAQRLGLAGLIHYEVSNFAEPGRECRHNWYYWNRKPYLGIGPSSHGFLPPFRIWNSRRWDRYRDVAATGPVSGVERLTPEAERLERIWLGLRTRRGLPASDPAWNDAGQLARWIELGWLERRGASIVATLEGWLRLDALVATIAGAQEMDGRACRSRS